MNNGRRWSSETRKRARKLRKKGLSYSEIQILVGNVAKSTLGIWFNDLPHPNHPYFVNRREWMKHIQKLAVKAKKINKQKKIDVIAEKATAEVNNMKILASREFNEALLSMLYWAEGSKTGSVVQFVNTDPRLVLIFVKLLRKCYLVDECKFRVRLHLHYYHKARESVVFWSDLLDIPRSQFGKIFWKKRGKEKVFRRNRAGICTVRYNSTDLQRRILLFGYALGERLALVAQRIERVPAEDEMQVQFLPRAQV